MTSNYMCMHLAGGSGPSEIAGVGRREACRGACRGHRRGVCRGVYHEACCGHGLPWILPLILLRGSSGRWPWAPTAMEVSSSARSSKVTAFRQGCRSSTPTPTRNSKSASPIALEKPLQVWYGKMLADSGLPDLLWRQLVFTAVFVGNMARTPRSPCIVRTKGSTGRSRICNFFEASIPGPSSSSRRTPKGLNSRRLKDGWWDTATAARAVECTIRPPGALWSAGTLSSPKHHRTYFRHRWKKLRSGISCRATAWAILTTSQTMTSARSSRLHFHS